MDSWDCPICFQSTDEEFCHHNNRLWWQTDEEALVWKQKQRKHLPWYKYGFNDDENLKHFPGLLR